MAPLSTEIFESLASGLWITIRISVSAGVLALLWAFILGIALRSQARWIRIPARVTVELLRGVSILVCLFFAYYVLPLMGVTLEAFWAGTLGIGLSIGAYGAEVVRGGFAAVPVTQAEAAHALGMPNALTVRRVLLPQAILLMLPGLASLQILLVKSTALVSLVAIADLTAEANRLGQLHGGRTELYALLLVVYFIVSYCFAQLFRWAERHFQHFRIAEMANASKSRG